MSATTSRLAAALAAGVLLAAGCTAGGGQSGVARMPALEQTIEVWHGWSAPHEVKAFQDAVAGFNKAHPNITVKLVKGQTDERITNAVRGGNPPDVVSSFTTDSVGQWCQSGAWQNLAPYIAKSKLDMNQFPQAVQKYTRAQGRPVRDAAARRRLRALLQQEAHEGRAAAQDDERADRAGEEAHRSRLGRHHQGRRVPAVRPVLRAPGAASRAAVRREMADRRRQGELRRRSRLPGVPEVEQGSDRLVRLRQRQEVPALDGPGVRVVQPFQKGKVAMAVDGEWRTKFIQEEAPKLDYGTAPLPVSDDRARRTAAGSSPAPSSGSRAAPSTRRPPGSSSST